MIRTYTYKLYRNDRTEAKFNRWLGVCRYVYNAAKETKEISYKEGLKLSAYDLNRQLTDAKKALPWLSDVSSQTLQGVVFQLDLTYQNFFNGRTKYPKWASKKTWKSFVFTQNVKQTEKGFNLPKFGKVKVFNNRKVDGAIKTARLIKKADGIYLNVVAEVTNKTYCNNENQVGIDMGIKYFCVTSDGEFIENPKFLEKQLRKLRVEQRKLSRKFKKGKQQSNNFYKQANVVARLHKKVVDCRKDFLHKKSTYLVKGHGTVFHEDLKITNMVKSNLSRHISDVSWGTFFEMLEYKANNLVRVNPAYTSQKCSCCGHVAKENRLTQSIFKCVKCGHEENADLNAAQNILKLGASSVGVNVVH